MSVISAVFGLLNPISFQLFGYPSAPLRAPVMEKPNDHHKKSPKQSNSKKKPVKVVYISNPMKVKASVSNFRALVQGLTGRDSDPADMENFLASFAAGVDGLLFVPSPGSEAIESETSPVPTVDHERDSSESVGSPFDFFDDVFTPEMMENFTGLSPSASRFYEPQAHIFRSFDTE